MSENNGLRVTVVLALFFGSIAIVFSPVLARIGQVISDKFTSHTHDPNEKLTSYVNLKRGIDMVGGTSLVYEIKKPEGAVLNGHLASDVARAAPSVVSILRWRSQPDLAPAG